MSKKRLPTSCSLRRITGLWTIKQTVAVKPDKSAAWDLLQQTCLKVGYILATLPLFLLTTLALAVWYRLASNL